MLNKVNILKLIGIGSLCLFLLGCSEESFLMQENVSGITLEEEAQIPQKANEEEDISWETASTETIQPDEGKSPENQMTVREIAVHICGAVNQPGVYYFTENQRLHEAIAKAGGFREDANEDYLNQALLLEDGMKIVVPTMEETALEEETDSPLEHILSIEEAEKNALKDGYLYKKKDADKASENEQKVDLNTADEALLCTLPGIGESRAKSIIAYRQENGPFGRPEEVMKVSGIKAAAYEKIKDYIMVSK